MISENQPAPDFTLLDQDEQSHRLSDYKGTYVLVYFYPKDDTPGCTKEACMIRDVYQDFDKKGITVFGISADSPKSHKKFEEKYELPFRLLSDPDKKVIESFGALKNKSMFGKTFLGIIRSSFLIDPQGNVARVYPKVDPATHAIEILKDFDELEK